MSRRDRARPKARREAFRDPRPRVLFVTEGRVTEKQYLIGFEKTHELSAGLELAVSNPCYLHFAEQPGAQARNKVAELLKETCERLRQTYRL